MINKNQTVGKKLSIKEMKQLKGGFEPLDGCVGIGSNCINTANCCKNGCSLPNQFEGVYCVSNKCRLIVCA